MRSKLLGTGGLVLALVLLFAVNIGGGAFLSTARLDLTEHKLFTLSPGTRSLLANLDEPLTMRLYVSRDAAKQMPGMNSYANRVEALLEEYARAASGRVRVQVIDPEPFSEDEDRAVGYGLRGLPVGTEGDTLYFGLVGTNSTDDEDVIPFLTTDREEFLEYDLTKLVHNLANPEQPTIGLLITLPVQGQGPQAALRGLNAPPWMIVEQIDQIFELRTVEPTATQIDDDIDVLMIVHPKGLPDRTRYAIDQFVLGGGRALVFVDAHAEADQGSPMMPAMNVPGGRASQLDDLLRAWGLSLETGKVVADLALAVKVRAQQSGRMVTFEYPVWLSLGPDQLDQNDIVTANLGNLALGSPGHLETLDDATTKVAALMRTTDGAALVDPALLSRAADPQDIVRQYTPAGRAFTLGVRVTGKATSAFPDGPPPAQDAGEDEAQGSAGGPAESVSDPDPAPEHLAESTGEVNLLVFADTDLLQDHFWVSVQELLGSRLAIPSAANGSLVVNALDNLEGSSDLISVRNRGNFLRPFERINALRRDAELEFRAKEQELIARLDETEERLVALEERKQGADSLVLTTEQQVEIARFRDERLRIRRDLREVRRELRASIERLETRLEALNVALVPVLIGVVGSLAALWRRRRRVAHG